MAEKMPDDRAAFPPRRWIDEDGMSWDEVSDETDSEEYVSVAWLRNRIAERMGAHMSTHWIGCGDRINSGRAHDLCWLLALLNPSPTEEK